MTDFDSERIDRALALAAPFRDRGFTVRPSASGRDLVFAAPGLGIAFVSVEGILRADDAEAYCKASLAEGSTGA